MKRLLTALLIVCAHSAYSMGGCWDFLCCDGGLGTGFYAGVDGSFGGFNFEFEDRLLNSSEIFLFDYDAHQIAEGGGFFLGYGMCLCDRYRLALQFDANWYGNTAKHSYSNGDIENSLVNRVQCDHLYDLSLRPGVMIGECLLFNFQVGVSWAGIDFKSKTIDDETPNALIDRKSKHFNETGYVLGAGVQVALTCNLSAVFDYSFHRFSTSEKRRLQFVNNNDFAETKLTRLSANLFKFGLAFNF